MDHFISRVADFKSKLPKIVRDLGFRKGIFASPSLRVGKNVKGVGRGKRVSPRKVRDADLLAKSHSCYCKFPRRFQCQPKLVFEPGIRAKALSLCHFVARSGFFFFFVNILLLHLTGFHIFCSPPLVR